MAPEQREILDVLLSHNNKVDINQPEIETHLSPEMDDPNLCNYQSLHCCLISLPAAFSYTENEKRELHAVCHIA
jgi:hypothetical protein